MNIINNQNIKLMKTRTKMGWLLICFAVIIACGIYDYMQEKKATQHETLLNECCLIQEADSLDNYLRYGVYNVNTREFIELSDEEDNSKYEDLFTEVVGTEDYEKFLKNELTDEEIKQLKWWIKFNATPEEEHEYCNVTLDSVGNTINHYHQKDGEVIEPSRRCEDCFRLVKYR